MLICLLLYVSVSLGIPYSDSETALKYGPRTYVKTEVSISSVQTYEQQEKSKETIIHANSTKINCDRLQLSHRNKGHPRLQRHRRPHEEPAGVQPDHEVDLATQGATLVLEDAHQRLGMGKIRALMQKVHVIIRDEIFFVKVSCE